MSSAAVDIDGSTLEGGGQVLRSSMSLAWLRMQPLHIHSIRAGRAKPGLANQHLTSARLCATLNGMSLAGDALRSTELRVAPQPEAAPLPAVVVADATTSGATTLMLQAALPPLLFRAPPNTELSLVGGTDVPFSPLAAHSALVLGPLLGRMGARLEMRVARRGFMPDVGEVRVRAALAQPAAGLRPLELTTRGAITAVTGLAVASPGGAAAAAAMVACLEPLLRASAALAGATAAFEVEPEPAAGTAPAAASGDGAVEPPPRPSPRQRPGKKAPQVQLSVQLVAASDTGCLLSANRLCNLPRDAPGPAVEREARALLAELETLLASGACACEHTCDQLIVYMALARGTSRLLAPPAATLTSQHLPTAIHFASLMTGATFRVTPAAEGGCQVVECDGVGAVRAPD